MLPFEPEFMRRRPGTGAGVPGARATFALPRNRSRGPGPADASPVRASPEDDPRGR